MIIDNIKNASKYYGLSPNISTALRFLQANDLTAKEPGRYEIDGSKVYVMVQRYGSRTLAESKWEAHRNYIDIQYVADGIERMGYAYIGDMTVTKPYDPEGDYLLLDGAGSMLTCPKGTFVIFGPEDAHMPGVAAGASVPVVKLVFKAKVEK